MASDHFEPLVIQRSLPCTNANDMQGRPSILACLWTPWVARLILTLAVASGEPIRISATRCVRRHILMRRGRRRRRYCARGGEGGWQGKSSRRTCAELDTVTSDCDRRPIGRPGRPRGRRPTVSAACRLAGTCRPAMQVIYHVGQLPACLCGSAPVPGDRALVLCVRVLCCPARRRVCAAWRVSRDRQALTLCVGSRPAAFREAVARVCVV